MKIVHIINGLGDGGAEHTLYKICKYDKSNQHIIISLTTPGKYYNLLKNINIKVYCLNANLFSINKFFYLIKLLRLLKPDIVQTWLLHSDLVGSIAAKLIGINKIVWNIRYSNLKGENIKISSLIIIKILTKLSFLLPKAIVVVSKRAKKIYEKEGYDKTKLKYIPNGYDLSILKKNKFEGNNFKKKIKIEKKIPLIGNVSRYSPKKNHLGLIKSLSILRQKKINFFCILAGSNINQDNFELMSEIKKLKLSKFVKLLNQNNNVKKIMNGIDIYVQSSSFGEGFPNIVAEAMACGTPCVVTDVGDARYIVGKNGWVVPPKNENKLANAIQIAINEINSDSWKERCNNAIFRIKSNFDIYKMIKLYNDIWDKVYKMN